MYINFSIRNFWQKHNIFKTFFSFHRQLSKFKHLEIECVTDNFYIFSIEGKLGFKEDHAGLRIGISLLGKEVYAHIYDSRHWDYKNNCWITHEV